MMDVDVSKAIKILGAWHRIEFFQPYSVPERLNKVQQARKIKHAELTSGEGDVLPWLDSNTRKFFGVQPEQKVNFYIYLGIFDKVLLKELVRDELGDINNDIERAEFEERLDVEGDTCYAKLMVDEFGVPDFSEMSVSTLPWALGHLKCGTIDQLSLANFDKRCKLLQTLIEERISALLLPHPQYPELQVVTPRTIIVILDALYEWAQYQPEYEQEFVISIDWIEASGKKKSIQTGLQVATQEQAVSTEAQSDDLTNETSTADAYQPEVNDEDEEKDTTSERILPILNSFYIEDIERAINNFERGDIHQPLLQYLSGTTAKFPDLYTAEGLEIIKEKLHPGKTPSGRWPSNPLHNMSLMQQFAINVAFDDMQQEGLLSINGPPGTGKTTLLRDIIAENIVRRAEVLNQFNEANDTLDFEGYPKESLFGYEMVVASSNNSAVENVSRELPLRNSIDNARYPLSYLEPVANQMLAPVGKRKGKVKLLPMQEEELCWGAVAAALGNMKNRKKFIDRFAIHQHYNPETIFHRAHTENYLRFWDWKNYVGAQPFAFSKKVFTEKLSALREYETLIQEYLALKSELENDRSQQEILRFESDIAVQEKETAQVSIELKEIRARLETVNESIDIANYDLSTIKEPHIFVTLLRLPGYARYLKLTGECRARITEEKRSRVNLKNKLIRLEKQHSILNMSLNDMQHQKCTLEESVAIKQSRFERLKEQLQGMVVPAANHKITCAEIQRNAYWQNETINHLRSELFCAAMGLHESWCKEVSEHQLFRNNVVRKFADAIHARDLSQSEKVFKSLFLMVPVISTTFASLGMMFEKIPPDSLGWLLIDEAGQAVPQAAVGGILRAKRTLVVGDPLQIEPVFTTPPLLVDYLSEPMLGEELDKWVPHRNSVQQLADRANPYGCELNVMDNKQWIGIPLWVHRRCIEPMFTIANEIAYNGRMLHGNDEAAIMPVAHERLGENKWITLEGSCTHKQFNPLQQLALFSLLQHLRGAKKHFNGIYIITPFRAVKLKLQQQFSSEIDQFMALLNITDKKEYWQWCRRNIGTVHTFQGKENAAVIFVLGCDRQNRGGAYWASSKPNLLNVAVTRAKSNIYFIGDTDVWSGLRYFNVAARELDIVREVTHNEQLF